MICNLLQIGLALPRLQEMNADPTQGEVIRLNNRSGLANLSQQLLQVEMTKSKRIQNSLWDMRHLSHAQIKYAAYDAIYSRYVYRATACAPLWGLAQNLFFNVILISLREIFDSAVEKGAFTARYFREVLHLSHVGGGVLHCA